MKSVEFSLPSTSHCFRFTRQMLFSRFIVMSGSADLRDGKSPHHGMAVLLPRKRGHRPETAGAGVAAEPENWDLKSAPGVRIPPLPLLSV